MKIQAYSPLTRTIRLENLTLEEIALRHARSPAQVLIRWNLQLGTVPLPKASRLEHLRENIDVFDFELSKEDMAALDDLNEEFSSLGSLPYV
ncbi:MAG: aldo/keto reductase [Bauldia litoralis]